MCDYSLHGIRNRLAKEGETLVVHRFFTGSKGLTAPEYVQPVEKPRGLLATIKQLFASPPDECAVCIPDGAKLVLYDIPADLQRRYFLCDAEPITFRQLSADPSTYRDAMEFCHGVTLRLQDLEEGQRVSVVALSPAELENAEEFGTSFHY
jgi:hypothetical protein